MKRASLALGLIAAALVAAGAYWLLPWGKRVEGARPPAPAAEAGASLRVELAASDVVAAERMTLSQQVPVSGSLRALHSAFVKARVSGDLLNLDVREGDRVRAGEVIGRIDATEYQARLRQAREQAEAARAQVDIAQRQYDNNKALVEQGFISRTALESSSSTLQAARATYQAAASAADVARKAVDDAALRAPLGGVVSQRLAQPGERLSLDARVVEVIDPSRLELEAMVTAAESVRVRVGQAVQLRLEGLDQPVAAKVARINPAAQAGTRSVPVYLAVSPAPGLRQGLFAQGFLATGQAQVLAVPLSAVRTDKPDPYVQVVEGGRIAHRRVQTGERGSRAGEAMVGVTGIEAGAQVLLGHVGSLREGSAVAFTALPAAPGKAAAAAASRTAP